MENETGKPEITEIQNPPETPPLVPVKRPPVFNKDNASYYRSLRGDTYRRRKSTQEIFAIIDKELEKTDAAKNIPREARKNLTHYLTVRKLVSIAYRTNTNKKVVEFECPECKKKARHYVDVDNLASEDHSIKALSIIYDRLAPKLGSLHVDVAAEGQVNAASDVMAEIIMRYVPLETRKECMEEIRAGLSRLRGKYGEQG